MAFTYATLKAAIESYLQNQESAFDTTYADVAVRQAEDRIFKSAILPVNRKNAALTFVAGTVTAVLPTDFLAPFELRAVASNVYWPVDYVDVSLMREAYPDPTVTGRPRWYSMFSATTIILSPTPDATAAVSGGWLNYFFKPQSLVDAGGSNTTWLATNAENCLLYGALSEAYTYMKGEKELQDLYEGKFQAALSDLKKLGQGMDMGDSYRMGERRQDS